ncbi:MAG TPA: ABC transporter permease, partial [Candidatus Polarisedimenticolaceae bacterium]|nr:ABC transporter permease [Candidatus Polarisedimenticolaceae bacterium]
MNIKNLSAYSPAVMAVAMFFLLWELAVRIGHISSTILPAPSLIVSFSAPYWGVIAEHSLQTLLEAVTGLMAAVVLGVAAALALNLSTAVRKALYPLLVSSQTIPVIALAPLLLIWLGYGLLPKVIIVTMYCFFPIAIATAAGLASVDPQQINLFRTMKASRLQLLRFVSIPTALPAFFSGLKIAVAYSMTGAIVGEYVGASKGLGIFIQTSANAHAVPLVFAAIFFTAII